MSGGFLGAFYLHTFSRYLAPGTSLANHYAVITGVFFVTVGCFAFLPPKQVCNFNHLDVLVLAVDARAV